MKNEKILCVRRNALDSKVDINLERINMDINELESVVEKLDVYYINRNIAELDMTYKQIIPYMIVTNEHGNILTYKRKGNETRLHGLLSAGLGGHVNECDNGKSFYNTIFNGACRELEEELPGIKNYDIEFRGIINEEYSEVGKVHTGFVFIAKVRMEDIDGYDDEIADYKWIEPELIMLEKFELWSKLAVEVIKNIPRKLFLVFSHKLMDDQIVDAEKHYGVGSFIYLPEGLQNLWSGLRPDGALDVESVELIFQWLKSESNQGDMVLVQGDFGAVHYFVDLCDSRGLIPVYSTTYRDSTEHVGDDGRVAKTHFFRHVGFRRFLSFANKRSE